MNNDTLPAFYLNSAGDMLCERCYMAQDDEKQYYRLATVEDVQGEIYACDICWTVICDNREDTGEDE